MPMQFFTDLTRVFECIEQQHMDWPEAMSAAWIAAIPKTRREAGDIRPIAILPVLHRLWSSVRGQAMRQWLNSLRLQPHSQCAYREGRCAEGEVAMLGALYERSAANGTSIASVRLDFSKAFDTVRHEALGRILQRLGLTPQAWELLSKATLRHTKRWRLAGQWLGAPFQATTGIAQGCSLSVCTFGAYLLPLMRRLEVDFPAVTVINYADDLVLAREQLQRAVNTVAGFANRTGLRLNPRKSSYWLHGRHCDRLPATIDIGDAQLIPQENVEVLGAQMATNAGVQVGAAAEMEARMQEANRRCKVLQSTPTSWKQRTKAIAMAVQPCVDYASWARKNNTNRTRGQRHLVAQSIHGGVVHGPRAIEIVLTAFAPVHTVDPKWSGHWRHLKLWSRKLSAVPANWQLLRRTWEGRVQTSGPIMRVTHILHELQLEVDWEEQIVGRQGIYASLAHLTLQNPRDQHAWRELIRLHEMQLVEDRRNDMSGLSRGLDGGALRRQHDARDAHTSALLRTIQCGALVTNNRQHRHRAMGNGLCSCGNGPASIEHVAWHCQHTRDLWEGFGHVAPIDAAERRCGLPMQDRPAAYRDALADHMVATWRRWITEPQAPGEQQRPEELRHFRAPRGLNWLQHPDNNYLQREEHGRYVRCAQCRFTVPHAEEPNLAMLHAECRDPVIPIGWDPLPKEIPPYLSLLPGVGGGPSRLLCRVCGSHDHVSQRALSRATLRLWSRLCECRCCRSCDVSHPACPRRD